MANRSEVYAAIEKERTNQDTLWPRTERRKVMYSFTVPHLMLIEERINRMRSNWYNGDVKPEDFIKIAAIAVRALEEIKDENFTGNL